jgi:N-carbamoylputrescine amidase
VIDADGSYLGKYRKNHIPHCAPGFWEKFYFRPGNLGYPVFRTRYADVGVYICYDRHFPEGARELGLIVGAINRVGYEDPWRIGEFYGQSYFCNPRGQVVAEAKRDRDELVTAELDLDQIREVRNVWQFYRDRRPETYSGIGRL